MIPGYPIVFDSGDLLADEQPWDLQSKVASIMSRPPVFVDEEATLREAAEMMAEEGIGALILAGPELPIRILTERDIVNALADGADPDWTEVGEVASTEVVSAEQGDTVAEVIEMMADYSIRHVPVVSGGTVFGMISARDIVRGLTSAGTLHHSTLPPGWTDTSWTSPARSRTHVMRSIRP